MYTTLVETENLKAISFISGVFGCNTTLWIQPKTKETIAIDPGIESKEFISCVQEMGLNIKTVLHTHAHYDHIGSAQAVRKALGAKVWLHQRDLLLYQKLEEQGRWVGRKMDPPGELDGYLEDEQIFNFAEISEIPQGEQTKLQVLFTPGHTQGSCCFFSELANKVPLLFAGDTLFRRSIGRTDLPGGDGEEILKSIKNRLFTLPEETICVPGHGPLTSVWEEKKHNPFFNAN